METNAFISATVNANTFSMHDKFLSVSQVAAMKRVSRNAVYKAVREKRLASVHLVGIIAIKREDATAWVPKARTGRRKGISTSEETKAKIAASQRKRWQRRKEENP